MSDIIETKETIRSLLIQARDQRRNAPDETIALAQRALKLAIEIKNEAFIANAYQWLGIGHTNISNYQDALRFLRRSLELNEKNGRMNAHAGVHSNIGYVYAELTDFDNAHRHYMLALDHYKRTENQKGIADINSKLGTLRGNRGEIKRGLKHHYTALDIKQRLGDQFGVGMAYHNIGYLEKRQGNYTMAMEHLEKALRIRLEIDDKRGIALTSIQIARILQSRGEFEKALEHAHNAHEIAQSSGLRQVQMESWETLSSIQADIGQYEEALRSHQRYTQKQQELFGKQFSIRIATLQTMWATEKHEQEIEMLRKDKEILELENRNAALAMAVTASHELNQPLMILQGNLEMMLSSLSEQSPQQQKYVDRIDDSMDRIRKILQKFKTASELHFEAYSDDATMVVFEEDDQEVDV